MSKIDVRWRCPQCSARYHWKWPAHDAWSDGEIYASMQCDRCGDVTAGHGREWVYDLRAGKMRRPKARTRA